MCHQAFSSFLLYDVVCSGVFLVEEESGGSSSDGEGDSSPIHRDTIDDYIIDQVDPDNIRSALRWVVDRVGLGLDGISVCIDFVLMMSASQLC